MSYHTSAPRLPLSPASPPESGVKAQSEQRRLAVTPRTPPSPDHMSVATKSYASPYQNGRHTNEMESREPDTYRSQSHQPSIASSTSQQPNNLKRPFQQDEEEKPTSKRQKKEESESVMDAEPSFAATNHDRQQPSVQKQESRPAVSFEEEPDAKEIPSKDKAELDAIFNDVGPALLTRRTIHKRAAIDMNQHLLATHGLHDLLTTVARIDPTTGEKINKLRKSYEGQIKSLQLSGRNKTVKELRADDEPSKLRRMATMNPQDFDESLFDDTKVGDLGSLRAIMSGSLRLNSGTLNNRTQLEWDDVLGHDPPKKPVPLQQLQQAPVQARQPPLQNGVRPTYHQASASADKVRTRGKKRSYGDASFEGYKGFAEGNSEPEESDRDRDYTDNRSKRRKA